MIFNSMPVRQLFRSGIAFQIPVYQRAYSWGKDQWRVFLEDLVEGQSIGNTYSFGNLLLEDVQTGRLYDIIDGQQRITTMIIFMRAMVNVIKANKYRFRSLSSVNDLERDFIKDRGVVKLTPAPMDAPCFDALIVQNKSVYTATSPSQQNIIDAKDFFTSELMKMQRTTLENIMNYALDANVNQMVMTGKPEAALMFELQNNRGKRLTTLERLKSFFMYQMYVYSPQADVSSNIASLAGYFSSIYSNLNDLVLIDEDDLLRYHCYAYLGIAFGYRNMDDIVKEFRGAKNKVQWVMDFTYELNQSFINVKALKNIKNVNWDKLVKYHVPPFAYAFIIKGLKYNMNEPAKMADLFELLEKVAFRVKLIGSRADFESRMSDPIRSFQGDVGKLAADIRTKLNDPGSVLYWSDNIFKQRLEGDLYGHGLLHDILWEYEASLLKPKGYTVKQIQIADESIEHISPQTPLDKQGNPLTCYDIDITINKYSNLFIEKYLNCIGNLLLISKSQNSSVGNEPFVDKLASYNSCKLLLQQMEIGAFVSQQPTEWKTVQIEKRRDQIVNFCLGRWKI